MHNVAEVTVYFGISRTIVGRTLKECALCDLIPHTLALSANLG